MRIYTPLFGMLIVTLLFVACSKNNDSGADNPLVGTWSAYATHDSTFYKPFGVSQVKDSTYTSFYQKFIFRSDNTCTLIDSTGTPGFVANLQYQVTNGKFILGLPGSYDTAAITIAGNQFTLVAVTDDDSTLYWQSTIRYRKE